MPIWGLGNQMFQHTAARRRLVQSQCSCYYLDKVSTHSRPKAAGAVVVINDCAVGVSTHSRPKAAGPVVGVQYSMQEFQHTAARRRLEWGFFPADYFCEFQHTAARRRLAGDRHLPSSILGFNTQPPEGGWSMAGLSVRAAILFQHTAARRRLDPLRYHTSPLLYVSTHSRPKAAGMFVEKVLDKLYCFNTQPPEGGWSSIPPFYF